jgi:hypothetical protein
MSVASTVFLYLLAPGISPVLVGALFRVLVLDEEVNVASTAARRPSGPDGLGEMAPATALVIDPGHAVLIASGAVFTEPVN